MLFDFTAKEWSDASLDKLGYAGGFSPSHSPAMSPSSSSGSSSETAHSLLNERPDTPLMAVKFEDFNGRLSFASNWEGCEWSQARRHACVGQLGAAPLRFLCDQKKFVFKYITITKISTQHLFVFASRLRTWRHQLPAFSIRVGKNSQVWRGGTKRLRWLRRTNAHQLRYPGCWRYSNRCIRVCFDICSLFLWCFYKNEVLCLQLYINMCVFVVVRIVQYLSRDLSLWLLVASLFLTNEFKKLTLLRTVRNFSATVQSTLTSWQFTLTSWRSSLLLLNILWIFSLRN